MADVPRWAAEKADSLRQAEHGAPSTATDMLDHPDRYPTFRAFARYITEHETPPVDPLLVDARERVARSYPPYLHFWAAQVRAGKYDSDASVQAVYDLLKEQA